MLSWSAARRLARATPTTAAPAVHPRPWTPSWPSIGARAALRGGGAGGAGGGEGVARGPPAHLRLPAARALTPPPDVRLAGTLPSPPRGVAASPAYADGDGFLTVDVRSPRASTPTSSSSTASDPRSRQPRRPGRRMGNSNSPPDRPAPSPRTTACGTPTVTCAAAPPCRFYTCVDAEACRCPGGPDLRRRRGLRGPARVRRGHPLRRPARSPRGRLRPGVPRRHRLRRWAVVQ
ncbi:MAG: hypothetical protein R3F43_10975 [bacterium]